MIRYFISDLHINNSDSLSELFIDFLNRINEFDELYIIGDLFEVWLGDDLEIPKYSTIIQTLKTLSISKKIYFIAGNRDFLIGENFIKQSGMIQLQDPYIFDDGNKTICLTHGDLFCTLDKKYQFFRKIVRNTIIRKFFLSLPYSFRNKIGNFIRSKSQSFKDYTSKNNKTDLTKFDINPISMREFIKNNNIDIVIHGHTHKPLTEKYDDLNCIRYVLAEWKDNSALILKMDQNNELPYHLEQKQAT